MRRRIISVLMIASVMVMMFAVHEPSFAKNRE